MNEEEEEEEEEEEGSTLWSSGFDRSVNFKLAIFNLKFFETRACWMWEVTSCSALSLLISCLCTKVQRWCWSGGQTACHSLWSERPEGTNKTFQRTNPLLRHKLWSDRFLSKFDGWRPEVKIRTGRRSNGQHIAPLAVWLNWHRLAIMQGHVIDSKCSWSAGIAL